MVAESRGGVVVVSHPTMYEHYIGDDKATFCYAYAKVIKSEHFNRKQIQQQQLCCSEESYILDPRPK